MQRRWPIVFILLAACVATHRADRERLQPPKPVIVQNGVDPIPEAQRDRTPEFDEQASDPVRRFAALAELAEMKRNKPQPPPPGPPPPPAPPNACEWSFQGPTNIHGRVLDIAIDPTNRDRLFLATVGGVWRSLDFARRWERVSDAMYAGTFGTVAINPSQPMEVFAGGGDPNLIAVPSPSGGIWRSTTGGAAGTWTKITPPEIDNAIIYRLRVDPKPPNDVYAATSTGVWRGVHSGNDINWSLLGNFTAWTSDVVLDSSGPTTLVYAAVMKQVAFVRGVWKWNGSQWLLKSTNIDTTQSRMLRLALAKSSPNILYAFVENMSAALQGIYKTTSSADSWQKLGNAEAVVGLGPCTAGYMYSLEVDPTDPDIVYSGCYTFARTKTGDGNWSDVTGGADPSWPYWLHADHHAVAFDPVDPKIVYVGHDGGLDRSSDTSQAVWHWSDVSHGLTNWQMYRVSGHHDTPTLAAGGAQDTGVGFTFGNRAWYHQDHCDGHAGEHDAGNSETFYYACQGMPLGIKIRTNAVPGTPGYGTTLFATPNVFGREIAVDRDLPGRVLAKSVESCGASMNIMKSVDGVSFSSIGSVGASEISVLHPVPGTNFQHYYVGVTECLPNGNTTIWRTTTGGPPWDTASSGLPSGTVRAITADPASPSRAFAAFDSSIVMTTTGGSVWASIDGNLPPSALRRGVVIDPTDANIIYAATNAGPFKGTIDGQDVTWEPFDEGLPSGVDVRDLFTDAKTKALVIGTWGYGVYRRELSPNALCKEKALLVRDNVFDRGQGASMSGVPDPEHPVPDPNKPQFFLADNSVAGRLYWWSSTDVRIDVPEADPPKNAIASADHVELETCPILIADCPSGTMIDSHPRRGKPARAYVQVTNAGREPLANARVIALWTDTTASTPNLPATFWTSTFPPIGQPCGSIAANSPWKLVDPGNPCRTISSIAPEMPEVAKFDWAVPADAPEKACFLTIVESADDPLPAAIRSNNVISLFSLVPQNRHMTVRNLHFVDPPMNAAPQSPSKLVEVIAIQNPLPDDDLEVVVSQPGGVRILLPREIEDGALYGVRKSPAKLTAEERGLAAREKLDPQFVYHITGRDGSMRLPVRAGETWRIALLAEATAPARLDIITRRGGVILGGSSYLFRARGFPRLTRTLH